MSDVNRPGRPGRPGRPRETRETRDSAKLTKAGIECGVYCISRSSARMLAVGSCPRTPHHQRSNPGAAPADSSVAPLGKQNTRGPWGTWLCKGGAGQSSAGSRGHVEREIVKPHPRGQRTRPIGRSNATRLDNGVPLPHRNRFFSVVTNIFTESPLYRPRYRGRF
jgi:hypothetical protein